MKKIFRKVKNLLVRLFLLVAFIIMFTGWACKEITRCIFVILLGSNLQPITLFDDKFGIDIIGFVGSYKETKSESKIDKPFKYNKTQPVGFRG